MSVLSQGKSCGVLLGDCLQPVAPAVSCFFFLSSRRPHCIQEVRGAAPDASHGSPADPTARGEGERLPVCSSSASGHSKPAMGSTSSTR